MTASGNAGILDVYDIACLAGGPDRMVDTALVALIQSGRVRIHRPGQLATVTLSRRHPVEAAVLDAVGPTGHRSVDTIRWRLATDDRLLDVARRLQREGLLGHAHRLVPHLSGGRSSPAPTGEGRRVLHRLEAQPPADDIAPDTDAMLVALCGADRLPDHEFHAAIFATTRTVTPFRRGSRSSNRIEAAAEAAEAASRTPNVIHGTFNEWVAPGGPTAPRNPSRRR
ncbi:TIGR04222 domain-containing membrane protein [Blastococcus sp. CT_GayMR16]|nr:TIGR04222 domain-containing membrane protein [Blastococcus sp. CT_GayMR16]